MRHAFSSCLVVIWLSCWGARVDAQCGATVSACRQCHEIDKRRPVLGDGKPWHKDHAFGDFCAACHGGDDAVKDEAGAHAELVDPLGNPSLACGTAMCHGAKAQALAAQYRRAAKPGVPAAAAPAAPARAEKHNAVGGIVAFALALLGGICVRWNERRRRAAEARS